MTHFVYAKIWEPIFPVDRGEVYSRPLEAALEAQGLGTVTGGGSELADTGEIVFVGLDLELANLTEAVALASRILEAAGAPRGSALELPSPHPLVPFGRCECVAIYLDGVSLPDDVYEIPTDVFTDAIADVIYPNNLGELRWSWAGPTETAIYAYGPDAEELFKAIHPILIDSPVSQNARVVVRHGNPALNPLEIRIPRHHRPGAAA